MRTAPCNKNASKNAIRLLQYLNSIEGKGMLTGQHTQTIPQEELSIIERETGKLPALCGFELLGYSPNVNWADAGDACLIEVRENQGTLKKAYEWAEKGGLITFTWHWFSPMYGRDKAFYAEHTPFSASKALEEGTLEHDAMCHDLDIMAEILRGFQEKDIPVIWRPFHESEGTWFWWGAEGPQPARDLYIFMWHYFTEKYNLNNLIWVWNSPVKEGYVGDEYCDIYSQDLYVEAHNHTSYADNYKALSEICDGKGLALAEVGVIPDIESVVNDKVNWLWYMTWSNEFSKTEQYNNFSELNKLYNHPYAITLDKLQKTFNPCE